MSAPWYVPPTGGGGSLISHAGGTSDAITGTFTPTVSSLTDGLLVYVYSSAANTTTTPTFAADATAATTIVKGNNLALVPGDIPGSGYWLELQYDATLAKWSLLNPATGVNIIDKGIKPVAASVAANALTLTLNPTTLDFRSVTLTDGTVFSRSVGAAISVVVPSSATLGTINATQARLAILAIDNAGTVELAVVNLAGGNNLDETTLISTTAISGTATAANVIYSTTSRTNVAFRVVGFIDITEATAGTWATAPTRVQGVGGQAFTAMASLGYGQTLQDVTASRALGTTYYNTTGKPIFISIDMNQSASNSSTLTINGIAVDYNAYATLSVTFGLKGVVPPGGSYSVSTGNSLNKWVELR